MAFGDNYEPKVYRFVIFQLQQLQQIQIRIKKEFVFLQFCAHNALFFIGYIHVQE